MYDEADEVPFDYTYIISKKVYLIDADYFMINTT